MTWNNLYNWQETEIPLADVCIIDSGPAGIAIANKLAGGNLSVVLLASGAEGANRNKQRLNHGTVTNYPIDISGSRYRCFGGTSHIWTGKLLPLNAIDYLQRD